ncbi:FHA domain-containing protein [Curtobacterium sp. RRHDQ10]|uniref:FHA domain-containing protein n=1 Tax=Curtobacterium phyllosphaerae TaxID=3413379 RepID=UPI003BF0BE0A
MPDDDVDDTVIRPRRAIPSGTGPGAVSPEAEDLADTVLRPIGTSVPTDGAGDPLADTVIRPRRSGAGSAVSGRPASPVEPAAPERRVASIRLGDRVVPLDRPVVLGRRPAGPRIPRGSEPLMLAVPSPTGQVSATHVTIHAEGAAVVVEDMRSTNGTFVRVPGAPPLRMRAGATMVVLTGTVVDIGDGNAIEILSPHLRRRTVDVDPAAGFPDAGTGFPNAERPTP